MRFRMGPRKYDAGVNIGGAQAYLLASQKVSVTSPVKVEQDA